MPPRTPRLASASTTGVAARGSRVVDPGEPRQPGFAEQRQVDREAERAQPRIGADVARRLLAPDVLLAGREGQHPAPPALGVEGLADQPPGHLPDEFLAAREEADMGPAEIERVAKGLG